ncbi:MAG: hypothetical protein ACOC9T_02905 [Myxococcota bacterium]
MGFLHRLKLQFRPPKRYDPDFGELAFMYVASAPEKSYWEAEWLFPPAGTNVSIFLLGPESGPLPEARAFYLALPDRWPALLDLVRPGLDQVFQDWYGRPLASDIWRDVKLAGFGLEDPRAHPIEWDISFEATGEKWLGIIIPFKDETPGTPIVDT